MLRDSCTGKVFDGTKVHVKTRNPFSFQHPRKQDVKE
jgi:hypothetical protein